MATPRCPKPDCGSSTFALTQSDKIKGARFIMTLIHCNSCGAVVGVTEHTSVTFLLRKVMEHLGISDR